MTDSDAFLAAICADPADLAPRLAYADWLEERGDPRGEFIRVQCQLADHSYEPALHNLTGFCDRCDMQRALRRRERELLDGVSGVEMLPVIEGLTRSNFVGPGKLGWYKYVGEENGLSITMGIVAEFHRGFVEKIALAESDWNHYSVEILACCPLREVTLPTIPAGCKSNDWPGIVFSSGVIELGS